MKIIGWNMGIKTIAVVGSRNFNDYEYFKNKLQYLISNITEDIQFVSGGAKSGADFLVKRFCREENYKLIEHLPDYEKYPPKVAPLKRNHLVVDDADMLVAYYNGVSRGTKYTLNLGEKKGIPIRIVELTEDNKPLIE